MKLSNLMVDSKAVWIDYPGLPGFEVEVNHLSRAEFTKLRKTCVSTKINRSTRQPEEVLNEDLFAKEFTKAVLKSWKGLKLAYLEDLLLVDISGSDPESEVPYDEENALTLVKGSTDFDIWLNEVVFDLDNFRTGTKRGDVEASE